MDNIELEAQRLRIRKLVKKTNDSIDLLNCDASNNMILDLIYELKSEVINLNLRIIDILEGQKQLELYTDRYFKIVKEVLNKEDMNIRNLKDYIMDL